MKKIPSYLHDINIGIPSPILYSTIENFSTQILHQRIKFTPLRMLDIELESLATVSSNRSNEISNNLNIKFLLIFQFFSTIFYYELLLYQALNE